MDRLTQHTPENFGYAEYELIRGADEQDVIDRLGSYEDTGLTPDEVELYVRCQAHSVSKRELELGIMLDKYQAIGNYDRLRELAQADEEGRVIILPKPLTSSDIETIKDIGRIVNNLEDLGKLSGKLASEG